MKTRRKGSSQRAEPGSGAARNSVRLLIADAVHSYRRFIKQVFESTGDLNVVGEAADGEEVVRLAQQLKPDVVLLDIDLPDLDGLEVIRRIKAAQPGTKVIVLSAVDGETYRKAAAKLGADAFLLKGAEDLGTPLCCRVGETGPAPSRVKEEGCARTSQRSSEIRT